ncbi:MAG: hypothetical protein GOV00_00700 [Candidatus Altiarchaeota archaeon]|nr:hypothetical protein [Candidatus Altiarchaeota archaeon]
MANEYVSFEDLSDQQMETIEICVQETKNYLKEKEGWDGERPLIYVPHTMDTQPRIHDLVRETLEADGELSKYFVLIPTEFTGKMYMKIRSETDGEGGKKGSGMLFYTAPKGLLSHVDALVGVSYADGKFGAGAGLEMQWGLEHGKPVYEMVYNEDLLEIREVSELDESRILSIPDTRERVKDNKFYFSRYSGKAEREFFSR